jgi:hypothetical protein
MNPASKSPSCASPRGRTLKWLKVKQPKYREGEPGVGAEGQVVVHGAAALV